MLKRETEEMLPECVVRRWWIPQEKRGPFRLFLLSLSALLVSQVSGEELARAPMSPMRRKAREGELLSALLNK